MVFRFEVRNTKYRNIIRVYPDSGGRPVGIIVLECSAETGQTMIHLPYVCPTTNWHHIELIWKHLTGHLPHTRYIAYIEDRPAIQRLAEYLGFQREHDYWQFNTED